MPRAATPAPRPSPPWRARREANANVFTLCGNNLAFARRSCAERPARPRRGSHAVSATLSPPPSAPGRDDDIATTHLSAPVKPAIRAATGATLLPVAVARAIAFVALAGW